MRILSTGEHHHFSFETQISLIDNGIFISPELEKILHSDKAMFEINIGYTDSAEAIEYIQMMQGEETSAGNEVIGINFNEEWKQVDNFSLEELKRIPQSDIITFLTLEKNIVRNGSINLIN